MNVSRLFIFLVSCPLLFGCDSLGTLMNSAEEIADLKDQISTLESRLSSTITTVSANEWEAQFNGKQIDSLRSSVSEIRSGYQAALTPTDTGYSAIQTNFGIFTIQISDIKPLGSGSRIYLKLGNPHLFTASSYTLSFSFLPKDDNGEVMLDKMKVWQEKLVQELPPGSWKKISIAIPEVTPGKLDHLNVSNFYIDSIRMTQAR